MKNINDLVAMQAGVAASVLKGEVSPGTAREVTHANDKLIAALNSQIKYAVARGEKPDIEFLNTKEGAQK